MKRVLALFVFFAALASHPALAGSFSVTPVRIFFGMKDRAVAITIVNEGDSEIALQADINSWTQDADGTDRLVPTEDLIVAPPILKLAPRAKQVVRLALVAPRDPSRQMTYRMLVREVPEATQDKSNTLQLPIALVLNMPVFVTPPSLKRTVDCRIEPRGDGLQALCTNTGNAYAQLREVEVLRGTDVFARYEGSLYLLPGARKAVPLKAAGAAVTSGPAQLRILFDDPKPLVLDARIP